MADKFNLDGFSVSTADVCTADGGFVGDVTGDITGQVFGTTTLYAADGAIALTDTVAKLNSATATTDMTLAAGTSGQKISVCAVLITNSMTVTADFGGAITTATFSAQGESMEVVSDGTAWYVVGNNGVVLS